MEQLETVLENERTFNFDVGVLDFKSKSIDSYEQQGKNEMASVAFHYISQYLSLIFSLRHVNEDSNKDEVIIDIENKGRDIEKIIFDMKAKEEIVSENTLDFRKRNINYLDDSDNRDKIKGVLSLVEDYSQIPEMISFIDDKMEQLQDNFCYESVKSFSETICTLFNNPLSESFTEDFKKGPYIVIKKTELIYN